MYSLNKHLDAYPGGYSSVCGVVLGHLRFKELELVYNVSVHVEYRQIVIILKVVVAQV